MKYFWLLLLVLLCGLDVKATDDILIPDPNAGKFYLRDNSNNVLPAVVVYTSDGNSNIVPISSGGGGSSDVNVTNTFLPVSQYGAWSVGIVGAVDVSGSSVAISNFPSSQNVVVTNASPIPVQEVNPFPTPYAVQDVNLTNASIVVTGAFPTPTAPAVQIVAVPSPVAVTGAFPTPPPVQVVSIPSPIAVTGSFPTPYPSPSVLVVNTVAVSGPLTDTQLRASDIGVDGSAHTQPVSGTFWQATQPVSGPLTDVQLRASDVNVNLTNSSVAVTGSFPTPPPVQVVAVPSPVAVTGAFPTPYPSPTVLIGNPSVLPTPYATQVVSGTVTSNQGSAGSANWKTYIPDNTSLSNSFTANSQSATVSTVGMGSALIDVEGTYSGEVDFTATANGTDYYSIYCVSNQHYDGVSNVINTVDQFFCPTNGAQTIKASTSNWVSGTATVSLVANQGFNGLVQTPNSVFGDGSFPAHIVNTVQSSQSGTWNMRLQDGAGSAVNKGQTTMSGSLPVAIASNQSNVPVSFASGSAVKIWDGTNSVTVTSNALKVDGSAVTQPVSGTVTANAGSGTFSVSGTVTANAGTNLNTSALALDATLAKLTLAQGASITNATGPMLQADVQSSASYSVSTIQPLVQSTAGRLFVDGSGVTQPVSGNLGRSWSLSAGSDTVNARLNDGSGSSVTKGQTTMTGSLPVTIASDQTALSVSSNINQVGGQSTAIGNGGTGNGVQRVDVANNSLGTSRVWDGTNIATVTASNALKVDNSAVTQPANITQFGGNNVATGTGVSGNGIPRVTVAQDSRVEVWDGTNLHPAMDAAARAGFVELTDGTDTAAVMAASTAPAATDTALVVAVSPNGGNPCVNQTATLVSATGATSGTSATQIVALAASKKIYICSLSVIGVSGTTPTFSLVQGTGSNCATGQTTVVQSWTTTAGAIYAFANPVAVGASGNALCYLDTGTTPVQRYTLTYVQQ